MYRIVQLALQLQVTGLVRELQPRGTTVSALKQAIETIWGLLGLQKVRHWKDHMGSLCETKELIAITLYEGMSKSLSGFRTTPCHQGNVSLIRYRGDMPYDAVKARQSEPLLHFDD